MQTLITHHSPLTTHYLSIYGSQLSSEDRVSCGDCEAGTFVFNKSSCVDCPSGTYAPSAQTDSCLECGPGFYTGSESKVRGLGLGLGLGLGTECKVRACSRVRVRVCEGEGPMRNLKRRGTKNGRFYSFVKRVQRAPKSLQHSYARL